MADTDFVTEAQVAALVTAMASRHNELADVRSLRDTRCSYWTAVGGGSTTATALAFALASAGTATAATNDVSTKYNSFGRIDYLVTTASTSAVAYIRSNNFCARGVSGYGSSGFNVRMRGGPATGVATSTHRFWMGLKPAANPTDVNPSTLVNMVGIGYDAADTQLQIMVNDGSGTATKVALGASFPKPTSDRSVLYQLDLSCAVAGSSIAYTVTELVSGATTSGTLSSDLPVATTMLAPHIYASVGGTSSVIGIAAKDVFMETSL